MTSKAAKHERNKRQRLKDAGLVKMEMWVLPENKATLKAFEPLMREQVIPSFGFADLDGHDFETQKSKIELNKLNDCCGE